MPSNKPGGKITNMYTLLLITILFLIVSSSLYIAADYQSKQRAHLLEAGRDSLQIETVTQEYFDKYISILLTLSELPCIRGQSGEQCDGVMRRLDSMFPAVVNFAALDAEGYFFASGRPFNRQAPPSIRGLDFFNEVRKGTGPYIMNPHTGPISREKVTGVIIPLTGHRGRTEGFVGVSVRFAELEDLWKKTVETSGHQIVIADRRQEVQFATVPLEKYVGRELSAMGLQGPAETGLRGELSIDSTVYVYSLRSLINSGLFILELTPKFTFSGLYLRGHPQVLYLGISLCIALILGFVLVGHGRHLAVQQRRAEDELRASEERYADLYENAPDMYVSVEASHGRIIQCNTALADVTGYTKDELIGRPLPELYHPDSREKAADIFRSFITSGIVIDQELKIQRKDGTPVDVSLNATAVRNAEGKVVSSRSVLRDITDHRMAEKELRESEERLSLALRAAQQGLYDLNVQTGEAVVNDEYAAMLGYDPATFQETNQKWRERLHPDDRDAVYRAYEEYIAGKRSIYQVEFRQQTQSGEWIWILSIGKIVERDSEGRPLRMLGTHTDITERKRIEEEVRKLNAELEDRVRARTEELEAKTAELERMNRLFVGRELRMKELKEKIRELEIKLASSGGGQGTEERR